MAATGLVSGTLVILENPTTRTALFLALAVWAFCRAYYFAFYVIEHYVDANFRFAGLTSFAQYLLHRRMPQNQGETTPVINSDERRGT